MIDGGVVTLYWRREVWIDNEVPRRRDWAQKSRMVRMVVRATLDVHDDRGSLFSWLRYRPRVVVTTKVSMGQTCVSERKLIVAST